MQFKLIFTILGLLYVLMASSMLVRGAVVLRDFGVPESELASPVLQDIFIFFYQYMAYVGVLMVLFGWVARERSTQLLVASVLCASNLLFTLRDLSTSDSRFGNHLYKGEATLMFVAIGLVYSAAFGYLTVRALLSKPVVIQAPDRRVTSRSD